MDLAAFVHSVLLALATAAAPAPSPAPSGPEAQLLPADFRVFAADDAVVNHPVDGFGARVLPTVNDFRGAPGCYVACYSHDSTHASYGVGGGIYVLGQVRVAGRYDGRVCRPTAFGHADISRAPAIAALCSKAVPACQGHCWGGGDTGGWFGIPG